MTFAVTFINQEGVCVLTDMGKIGFCVYLHINVHIVDFVNKL